MTLPRSEKVLNYAKAAGASFTALTALGAAVLSVWMAVKPPSEPLAKSAYVQLKDRVHELESDLDKAHDDRQHVREDCDARVKLLEERMQSFLSGISIGISSVTHQVVAQKSRSGGGKSETATKQPTTRAPRRVPRKLLRPQPPPQRKLEKPKRKALPRLDQLQQQVQMQEER